MNLNVFDKRTSQEDLHRVCPHIFPDSRDTIFQEGIFVETLPKRDVQKCCNLLKLGLRVQYDPNGTALGAFLPEILPQGEELQQKKIPDPDC